MTYTFKLARRLASNHLAMAAVGVLISLTGCGSEQPLVQPEQPGAITLTINGLAFDASPQVTLVGPDGYRKSIAHSGTVTGLAFGNYEIIAAQSIAQSTTFTPTTARQALSLSSAAPTAATAVQYQVATGAIDLRIEGIPASTTPVAWIEGPAGFSLDVASTAVLRGLAPGTYTVHAAPRSTGAGTFYPSFEQVTVNVVASLTPAVAALQFRQLTGALAVDISGLPTGAVANYVLAGPGSYNAALAGVVELTTINPGPYLAIVSPVHFEGHTWAPEDAAIPITVDTGRTHLEIVYRIITGALDIEVSGLPNGVPATVAVSGPGGFTRTATGDDGWVGLEPGVYTTTAATIRSDDREFRPKKTNQSLPVGPGRSPKKGRVEYTETAGAIDLDVTGLPSNVEARVVISSAGSVDTMTASGTLNGLADGSYTVTAFPVTSGDADYSGAPQSQVVSVINTGTASASVNYSRTTGSLRVDVTGLPSGTAAAVTVAGPGGYSRSVTATTTLGRLAPGTYSLTAQSVSVSGNVHNASPVSQSVTVAIGATATASVGYASAAPTTGSLSLGVGGLPSGSPGLIGVTGPGGFNRTVTSTTTLSGMAPGTYTVAAHAVLVGGSNYTPSPASQNAAVTAGATASRAVSYIPDAPSTGTLIVTVTGLPTGAAGSIAVTHSSGYQHTVTRTDTLANLATPATYVLTASSVTVAGTTYEPTPASQTGYVTAGSTVNRSVAYAAVTAPPPPPPPPPPSSATVMVDTMTVFQQMSGWEATSQAGQGSSGFSTWQGPLFDQAVNDLGLNRIRVEIKPDAETTNDNSNPNSINMAGFDFSSIDNNMTRVTLPLKQRLEARGERLYINLNYVAFRTSAGHLHSDPAEYAELILATFIHLRDTFGVTPNAVEVILEPDNGTFFANGTMIGQAIAATGARLAAAGFHPDFIGPSVMDMSKAVPFLDAIAAVPGALTYLREVSYHRYRGVSDANLAAIRQRAQQYGLRTAMLEHMASGVEDLYRDLTVANASAWQQFALAFPTSDNGAQYFTISGTTPVMGSRTKLLRQYFRYVREGAHRVAATSASGGVRPVAFTNPGGGMAVVLHVDAAGSYTVAGIRPGNYGVVLTTSSGSQVQLPNVTATSGAAVAVAPTQTGVLTLHRIP